VSWSSKKRLMNRIKRQIEQQQLAREDDSFLQRLLCLSDTGLDGKPRWPVPELSPEERAQMEAKRRAYEEWASSEEGIATIAREQAEHIRRHPRKPGDLPRPFGLCYDMRTPVLIRMSEEFNGSAAQLPPSEPPTPEPTEPPATLPNELRELTPSDEEDYDD
jgi:hypothetical protein